MSHHLNLLAKITFQGLIWKLYPDPFSDLIAFEIRSKESKQAHFYSLDVKINRIYINRFQPPDGWECGMQTLCNNILFLHGYAGSALPERRGVMTIDALTEAILWENPRASLYAAGKESCCLFYPGIEPSVYHLVHSLSGKIIEKANCSTLNQAYPPLVFPESINMNDILYMNTSNRRFYPERLITKDLHIISYYLAEETEEISHYIAVLTKEGQVIHQDILSKGVKGIAPDAFFIWDNKLIYIKNRSEFVAYLL